MYIYIYEVRKQPWTQQIKESFFVATTGCFFRVFEHAQNTASRRVPGRNTGVSRKLNWKGQFKQCSDVRIYFNPHIYIYIYDSIQITPSRKLLSTGHQKVRKPRKHMVSPRITEATRKQNGSTTEANQNRRKVLFCPKTK